MFRLEGGRPNDRRGFIHKRLLGGFKGLLTGGPLGAASGFLKKPARNVVPRTTTARPTAAGQEGKALGKALKFGGEELFTTTTRPSSFGGGGRGGPCPPGTVPDPKGRGFCIAPCSPVGRSAGLCDEPTTTTAGRNGRFPAGDAVMGQFGAALEPSVMMVERRVCRPGMQLGMDGLCYNKGAITNKQREWPRGRRPLLTGGDMRAIGVAARAGAKLDRTTKRLRGLGMMKKLPASRKAAPHQHAKLLPAVSVT